MLQAPPACFDAGRRHEAEASPFTAASQQQKWFTCMLSVCFVLSSTAMMSPWHFHSEERSRSHFLAFQLRLQIAQYWQLARFVFKMAHIDFAVMLAFADGEENFPVHYLFERFLWTDTLGLSLSPHVSFARPP
jgi:hypothetical protein